MNLPTTTPSRALPSSATIPPVRPSSYWQRRIARHLLIALCTLLCTALFWELFAVRRDLISRLSVATAYPALFLTVFAMALGPWNVLRRRANPISFDLRRDVGIWAGVLAILHTIVGLNVHLRGRPWLYFVDDHNRVRHDLFGFGNDTGSISALLFLLLLAISNDLSLRRLGTKKWKSLQRWTYAAAGLAFLHAVAYQQIEKRQAGYEALMWCVTLLLAGFQLTGWWIARRRVDAKE